MAQTPTAIVKTKPLVRWEKLPPEYQLPDEPVDDLNHPELASALQEILQIANLVTLNMLMGSNFGICANLDGKTVVKAPDWFYVPNAFPVLAGIIRRSYTPHTEGDPLAVVMEFLSDTEQSEYSHNPRYPYGKWYFYEQILQVPIYAIFNPSEATLEVYHLVEGRYVLQQPDANGRYSISPLNLYLGIWFGTKAPLTGNWLRWWDARGQMLPWGTEGVAQSLQQGIQQGIQQGKTEGKVELILRLLTRRFGTIAPEIQSRINSLSSGDLDELSETLLDFSEVSDLYAWLEAR